MTEFLRKDIDPLEKLVYFKTRWFFREKKEIINNLSCSTRQLEILFNCLDTLERISNSENNDNLTDIEKEYNFVDLAQPKLVEKYKSKKYFSKELILKLIYLIKDECTSINESENTNSDFYVSYDTLFSISEYKKIVREDRTLEKIYNEVLDYLNNNNLNLFYDYFWKCHEIFTKNILFNYELKFRPSLAKYHYDNLKIIVELVSFQLGFENLGTISDNSSI